MLAVVGGDCKEEFGMAEISGLWVLPDAVRGACLAAMKEKAGMQLLKGVSRSFYLSLRLLPAPMREAASLGYQLARTSDTLADTPAVAVEARLLCLDWFHRSLAGAEPPPRWPLPVLNAVPDIRERHLLEGCGDLLAWLERLPEGEAALVREVVETIISGQKSDLERFGTATRDQPVALADDCELEDYTWRVAGCVGAFWTRLGFLTVGEGFSRSSPLELEGLGVRYGKGLQLVNILRDLPADLADGRCYLPVGNPHDTRVLMECHQRWLARASDWLSAARVYSETLGTRRLRAASGLPGMIANATLSRMKDISWEGLEGRVKVPRRVVYLSLARALFGMQGS